MEKSKLEPQPKPSKLSMIPVHPTYGSHQAHVPPSLVYSTQDSRAQNHPLIKRTELPSILPMDQDPLKEKPEAILPPLPVLEPELFSEKSPLKKVLHS